MLKQFILTVFCLYTATKVHTQTLGGNAVFNFLNQPNSAQLASLGGVNISSISNDVSMSFHNPALLRTTMDRQLNVSFNAFLAGIGAYTANTAYHLKDAKLNIGAGIQYLNYGTLVQTDAAGNILGNFRPRDYMIQIMAAKQYKERFWFGVTGKFIQSNYGQYKSAALAVDIGLTYYDSAAGLQSSVVIKNLGTQINTYANNIQKEELPFDLQAGISKRLLNAPFQFSLTAHNLHRLNIYYNDSTFNNTEGDTRSNGIQKITAHLILSTQVYLSDHVELSLGYNFLRRQDLNVFGATSGLNGFSFGTALLFNKLQIRYATGFYQRNLFNQFSLNFNFAGTSINK